MKQTTANRDARISHVERGPGMSKWNVQIEQKEIDHVSVKKTNR